MSSYFITGAGRGLGLALVSQLSKLPPTEVSVIFAGIRAKPSAELQALIDGSSQRIIPINVNITESASVKEAAAEVEKRLGGKGLDVLINNAGVNPAALEGIQKMDNLRYALEVNVEAVQEVTAAFVPLLRKGTGKQVVNMSTTVGSFAHANDFAFAPVPAYKISKAALNMLTVQWAAEYSKEGFTIYAISPGWLKTDLGSQDADLDVDIGAKAVLDIILGCKPQYNGTFRNIRVSGWEKVKGPNRYDGEEVGW